jgi:hypothetical protein
MSKVELPAFDSYNRRARLWPMYFVLLPLGLAVAVWIPFTKEALATLGGLVLTLGLSMFLTQIARDMGKRKEPELWGMWGGRPSTAALSYRACTVTVHTLKRYHDRLRKLLPDLKVPTSKEEEEQDVAAADAAYDSCGEYLRERTRDKKTYALLFEENVAYGYRRNVWGMKPAGIASALIGLSVCLWKLGRVWYVTKELHTTALLSATFCATMLTFWLLRVNPDWVRLAADAYSTRLLASCETLEEPNPKPA